jgi:hypothetical protein
MPDAWQRDGGKAMERWFNDIESQDVYQVFWLFFTFVCYKGGLGLCFCKKGRAFYCIKKSFSIMPY